MKRSQQGEELRERCLVRGNSMCKGSAVGYEVKLERLTGDRVCGALRATTNRGRTAGRKFLG